MNAKVHQEQEAKQPLSLAELSRLHLSGQISTKEYLMRERQLLPGFGQYPTDLEKMLREVATEIVTEIAKSKS